MTRLFLICIDVFPTAIIILPILLLLDKMYFHDHRKTTFYSIYSLYLTAVYIVVGLPTITYLQIDPHLNLIPFLDIIYDLKNAILNIILFIPLGIIMPLLWERFRIFRISFLFGVGMSFIIEFLQLFTFRTTDINDILTNSAGTVLGYFISNIIIQKAPKSCNFRYPEHDIFLLCSLIFIIMFFIEPFISSAIWSMVL